MQGVQGITDLITVPGLINTDFADVKMIMTNAGTAIMGIGSSTGEGRAVNAARAAITSPLLEASIEGRPGHPAQHRRRHPISGCSRSTRRPRSSTAWPTPTPTSSSARHRRHHGRRGAGHGHRRRLRAVGGGPRRPPSARRGRRTRRQPVLGPGAGARRHLRRRGRRRASTSATTTSTSRRSFASARRLGEACLRGGRRLRRRRRRLAAVRAADRVAPAATPARGPGGGGDQGVRRRRGRGRLAAGLPDIGENYAQELVAKAATASDRSGTAPLALPRRGPAQQGRGARAAGRLLAGRGPSGRGRGHRPAADRGPTVLVQVDVAGAGRPERLLAEPRRPALVAGLRDARTSTSRGLMAVAPALAGRRPAGVPRAVRGWPTGSACPSGRWA